MARRWFHEWPVCDRVVYEIRRTVTEADNLLFTPLHLDAKFAAKSVFGKILGYGTFTFALMTGLSAGMATLAPYAFGGCSSAASLACGGAGHRRGHNER